MVTVALMAAVLVYRFEPTLDKVPELVFFLPVVMGMGGNVGIQAASRHTQDDRLHITASFGVSQLDKEARTCSQIIDNADHNGYQAFFIVGLIGAAMTAAYMTRATYLTFFGQPRGACMDGFDDRCSWWFIAAILHPWARP